MFTRVATSSHPRLPHPLILRFGIGTAQAATTLKISHQFPGGTIDNGDFRDRLCRVFAAEVSQAHRRRHCQPKSIRTLR